MPSRPRSVRQLPSAQKDPMLAEALIVLGSRRFGAVATAIEATRGRVPTPREVAAHMNVSIYNGAPHRGSKRSVVTSVRVSRDTPSMEVSAGAGFEAAIVDGLALLLVSWPQAEHYLGDVFRDETITAARTELRHRMMTLFGELDAPVGAVVIPFPMDRVSAAVSS